MEHLGYKFVREELRITPAKVVRVHYMQETLMCPVCRQEDETMIVEAKTPTPLLAHSPASPDMVAMVMYQKKLSAPSLFTVSQKTGWKKGCLSQEKLQRTGTITVHWNISLQSMK